MGEIIRHLVWFFVVACAVSYGVFLIIGSGIRAQALDQSRTVLARDSLGPGAHYLSGIVMIPRTCAQLSVRAEQLSGTLYQLLFTTWEEPSIPCRTEDTARSFRTIVFAPAAGVQFTGLLDGALLQIVVIPVVEHTQ